MRINYVCRRIRDVGGAVTGYEVKFESSAHVLPKGDYEIIYGEPGIAFPKVVTNEGKLSVVEDTPAKDSEEQKKNQEKISRQKLKSMLATVDDDIAAITNIASLKTFLSNSIKDMLRLISRD